MVTAAVPCATALATACGDNIEEGPHGRDRCDLRGAEPVQVEPQILFGDLHVHSTDSFDALALNLPLLGGLGNAGPEQRCDFARFCSRLDFWSLNDHVEEQTPEQWRTAIDAIRRCNDVEGGYSHTPSLVSYLGWEWTQSADSASSHWGHKNVILRDTCDDTIPARPIAAPTDFAGINVGTFELLATAAGNEDPDNADIYWQLVAQAQSVIDTPACETGVDSRELPPDCHEVARDPAELYEKLEQWGVDAQVIPHGNTWGSNTPQLASWRHQLGLTQHNPDYERLIEVYSGHGSLEQYRTWRHAASDGTGTLSCPEPTAEFEPCCYRAGEIVRGRSAECAEDPDGEDCATAVAAARQAYVDAGDEGVDTIANTTADDWRDCGQCRDCFQPAFRYRPGMSAQAALALSSFDDPERPFRYTWGFIGSSDSHRGGPGVGYTEDKVLSDSAGSASERFDGLVELGGSLLFSEFERQGSFYFSGGLVAVHAAGRSRHDIWDALVQRSVYATSGHRMLLWFDLVDGERDERHPMGSQVAVSGTPEFEVRAVGSLVQAPGCPDDVVARAPEGFVDTYCMGQCYNPTDERYRIDRIELVRITPQTSPDEDIASLIADPLAVFECPPSPDGCTATFSDPEFLAAGRPAAYYARVYQEPTPQLNGETLRCQPGAAGDPCATVEPCVTGYQGDGDDCLAMDAERAWASPIYLSPNPGRAREASARP